MAWRGSAYSKQPDALVRLASRLLLAQAAASAAIGISYSRRNLPWLAVTIVVAVAVSGGGQLVSARRQTRPDQGASSRLMTPSLLF